MLSEVRSEHRLVRDMVRRFVAEVIEPHARSIEESNDLPEVILQRAADLGLFGLGIPEEWGGIGTSQVLSCLVLEELGHGPAAATLYISPSAPAAAILAAGTTQQKDRFLARLASGEVFAAFCLSEPGAGSDASSITTRAEWRGDHWSLTGTKTWISRARRADVFLVSAITDPSSRGSKGITVFLLDARSGLSVGKPDDLLGLRGSGGADVHLDGVRAESDEVLGDVGGGFEVVKKTLTRARLWAAARAVGIAARSLELSLAYAGEREQFGRKIGQFQAIKLKLADMAADVYVARLLVRRAAQLFDADLEPLQETAIAKLFATEAASRAADAAVQIHGALGLSRDYPVERLYRDSRAGRILDGTSDIQRLIIAKQLRQMGIGEAVAPGGLA